MHQPQYHPSNNIHSSEGMNALSSISLKRRRRRRRRRQPLASSTDSEATTSPHCQTLLTVNNTSFYHPTYPKCHAQQNKCSRLRLLWILPLAFWATFQPSSSSLSAQAYSPRTASSSSLLFSRIQHQRTPSKTTRSTTIRNNIPISKSPASSSSSRTTALSMVLTTPESIIEQASTQKLLDDLIDESVRTSARRPIMMQFDPSSGWIWKRWKGTIFSETGSACLKKMAYAIVMLLACQLVGTPRLQQHLSGFNVLWGQMLQVTTFTLTFFLNQSYALWRKCYALSRKLQGRMHDINLAMATHATRKQPTNPLEQSTCTAASRQILELVARYVRLFNLLTYASFTRSHRPILTPRGMRRLVERGLLTPLEREILVDCELPATQRHNAILLWIARTFVEAKEAGHFQGSAGFENQILEKIHVARASYGAIGDELAGRMPLAYAHIVQVLVDVVLWMYPLMAISSNMSPVLAVLGTGVLTISYQGLFDLAKQFLDPYDNESFGRGEDPLVVDTLIAETNAGSVRWLSGIQEYPLSTQRIIDGDLSDALLPVRGISVPELEQLEQERLERERELQLRREKEEAERRKQEKRQRQIQKAAEAMIPAIFDEEDDGAFYAQLEELPTTYTMASNLIVADYDESILSKTLSNDDTTSSTRSQDDSATALDPFTAIVVREAEVEMSLGIADVVNRLDEFAGGVPVALVPKGTAVALDKPKRKKKSPKKKVPKDIDNPNSKDSKDSKTIVKDDQLEILPEEKMLELMENDSKDDVQQQTSHQYTKDNEKQTHTPAQPTVETSVEEPPRNLNGSSGIKMEDIISFFGTENPYGDISRFEEVESEGREIFMSQMLAEEDVFAVEKANFQQTALAEKSSSSTTQEKQATEMELPSEETSDQTGDRGGDESDDSDSSVRWFGRDVDIEEEEEDEYFDAEPLKGVESLWGGSEGEYAESPDYMAEAVGRPTSPSGATERMTRPREPIAPLPKEVAKAFPLNWQPAASMTTPVEPSSPQTSLSNTVPVTTSDGDDEILVQVDEDGEDSPEESSSSDPEDSSSGITLEDYQKKIAEILEAEKEELEETEAILNAPAFAESLEGFDDDDSQRLEFNETIAQSDDPLAVLEMDLLDVVVEEEMNDVATEEADLVEELSSDDLLDKEATADDIVAESGEEEPVSSDSNWEAGDGSLEDDEGNHGNNEDDEFPSDANNIQ